MLKIVSNSPGIMDAPKRKWHLGDTILLLSPRIMMEEVWG